jgi:hypothetical protein
MNWLRSRTRNPFRVPGDDEVEAVREAEHARPQAKWSRVRLNSHPAVALLSIHTVANTLFEM